MEKDNNSFQRGIAGAVFCSFSRPLIFSRKTIWQTSYLLLHECPYFQEALLRARRKAVNLQPLIELEKEEITAAFGNAAKLIRKAKPGSVRSSATGKIRIVLERFCQNAIFKDEKKETIDPGKTQALQSPLRPPSRLKCKSKS